MYELPWYELRLWDRINMPGREMGSQEKPSLPKPGQVFAWAVFPGEKLSSPVKAISIWRCGCWKDENPARYTVIVEKAKGAT